VKKKKDGLRTNELQKKYKVGLKMRQEKEKTREQLFKQGTLPKRLGTSPALKKAECGLSEHGRIDRKLEKGKASNRLNQTEPIARREKDTPTQKPIPHEGTTTKN